MEDRVPSTGHLRDPDPLAANSRLTGFIAVLNYTGHERLLSQGQDASVQTDLGT